ECKRRDISLGDTAMIVGVSASYLDKLLHASTGMTFTEHRRLFRVNAAHRLLVDNTVSAKEIASLVGYIDRKGAPDERRLRRDFRKVYGLSPTACRRAGSRFVRK